MKFVKSVGMLCSADGCLETDSKYSVSIFTVPRIGVISPLFFKRFIPLGISRHYVENI